MRRLCAAAQALTALSAVLAVAYATHRYAPAAARKVYLLDTFTYKPPDRRARRAASLAFALLCGGKASQRLSSKACSLVLGYAIGIGIAVVS